MERKQLLESVDILLYGKPPIWSRFVSFFSATPKPKKLTWA